MLEARINRLKGELANYASHAEEMINKSVAGVVESDAAPLRTVLDEYEPVANAKEIQFDDDCITLIAQFSPKATALRTIIMIMKMNNDIERIADHASNIARCGLDLLEFEPGNSVGDVPKMAEQAVEMLNDSISAFVESDPELAKKVCVRDKYVNEMKAKTFAKMKELMARDPGKIGKAMMILDITKNLERIADLTTNLSENVIFMIEGKNVKHFNKR